MTRDEYVEAVKQAHLSFGVQLGSDVESAHAMSDEALKQAIKGQKLTNIEQFADYQRSWADKWAADHTPADRAGQENVWLGLARDFAQLRLQMQLEKLHREYTGS